MPFLYQKINPSSGAPFTNAEVTAVAIAVLDAADGSTLLASTAMTWDANLSAYRYNWVYVGAARRVVAVMTPTRAVGISAALTPVDYETVDLADTLARIGKSSEAATDPSLASGTLFSKSRGTGVDTDALQAELEEIEGVGWNGALDNLHQAKLARDQVATQVAALDLRQSTNFIVPARMAPTKTYVIRLRIRDDDGVLVAPDATPTIEILEGAITGVTLGAVTADGGTGLYKANVALDGTADPGVVFSLRAAWTRTEGAVTNNEEALRSVEISAEDAVSDQILTDLATIMSRIGTNADTGATGTLFGRDQRSYDHLTDATYGLNALYTIVANIQAQVNHGTYGLAALNADIDAVAGYVGVDATATIHQKLGAFTAVLN